VLKILLTNGGSVQSSISYWIQTSHPCAQLKLLEPLDTLVGGGHKHKKSLLKLVFCNLNNNTNRKENIQNNPKCWKVPKIECVVNYNIRKSFLNRNSLCFLKFQNSKLQFRNSLSSLQQWVSQWVQILQALCKNILNFFVLRKTSRHESHGYVQQKYTRHKTWSWRRESINIQPITPPKKPV
jgi:hypothetical protein